MSPASAESVAPPSSPNRCRTSIAQSKDLIVFWSVLSCQSRGLPRALLLDPAGVLRLGIGYFYQNEKQIHYMKKSNAL